MLERAPSSRKKSSILEISFSSLSFSFPFLSFSLIFLLSLLIDLFTCVPGELSLFSSAVYPVMPMKTQSSVNSLKSGVLKVLTLENTWFIMRKCDKRGFWNYNLKCITYCNFHWLSRCWSLKDMWKHIKQLLCGAVETNQKHWCGGNYSMISAQLRTSFNIEFLDNENNGESNRLPLGLQCWFRIV